MVVDPWLADMLTFVCHQGIAYVVLIPPPLAPTLPWLYEFQVVSDTQLFVGPLVVKVVRRQP